MPEVVGVSKNIVFLRRFSKDVSVAGNLTGNPALSVPLR
jgi:hypothetical protein